MSLTSLTPDLLGLILTFDGATSASLSLWLCGSRLLHRQLALGVTTVVLRNWHAVVYSPVPRYLEELRHLRELTVDRLHYSISNPVAAWRTLGRLNPGLKKLSFRCHFSDGKTTDTAPSSSLVPQLSDSTGTGEDDWIYRSVYPGLETLEVFENKKTFPTTILYAHLLPPHLTSLTAAPPVKEEDFKTFMRALPLTLTKLKLDGSPPRSISTQGLLDLIPHQSWKELNLCWRSIDMEVTLPPTLTTLDGWMGPSILTAADLNRLPKSLITLEAHECEYQSDPMQELLTFGQFKSLTSVFVQLSAAPLMTSQTVRTLPPTITELCLKADLEGWKVTDWPRDLVHLEWLPTTEKYFFELLPSNLTTLTIDPSGTSPPMSSISLLPRTLTDLCYTCRDVTPNVEFPPGLRKLDLSEVAPGQKWVDIEPCQVTVNENAVDFDILIFAHRCLMPVRPKVVTCFPFDKLPRGLITLHLGCLIPASQLKHLPPRLVRLTATDIFEDADFDSKGDDNVAHMHEVFRIGKEEVEGVEEKWFTLSAEQALESSMASLLPRSLEHFELTGDIMSLTMDWPRIPPALRDFRMRSSDRLQRCISLDFLFVAPLSHLTALKIDILEITDAHVKALPKKLRTLSLTTNPRYKSLLTVDCLPYLDHDLAGNILHLSSPEVKTAMRDRRERRHQALQSGSLEAFQATLSRP